MHTPKIDLRLGDCLEVMRDIPDGSIDLILTDPPYGTVKGFGGGGDVSHGMSGKTEWDTAIDREAMLEECNRALRFNGALLLFCQEPYTSELITKAHGNLPFSYRLTWLKDHFANSLIAKKAPVNYTEDICVFFKKYDTLNLHPLREYSRRILEQCGGNARAVDEALGHGGANHFLRHASMQFAICTRKTYEELTQLEQLRGLDWLLTFDEMLEANETRFKRTFNLPDGKKFKSNVLEYRKDYTGLHPTQKPVALMEDLTRTYSQEGDTVLDFTMGSGSTGIACMNEGRNFIGIEKDDEIFKTARNRIESHEPALI